MNLLDKVYKLNIINIHKEETVVKELKVSMRTISCQIININKEKLFLKCGWKEVSPESHLTGWYDHKFLPKQVVMDSHARGT